MSGYSLNTLVSRRTYLAIGAVTLLTLTLPLVEKAGGMTIPLRGYQPLVAVSLTNEESPDDLDIYAYNTDTYLANGLSGTHALASDVSPHYEVTLYDTRSTIHLFTDDAISGFDLAGNNLLGTEQISVDVLGGSETFTAHDTTGVYVTGLGNATGGTSLSLNTSTLVGHYNVSVAGSNNPASILPNTIGLPLASQYTTVIRPDQRRMISVGSDVYISPDVQLYPLGNPGNPDYPFHATMTIQPHGNFANLAFLPNFISFDWHDNPVDPTRTRGGLFLTSDVSQNGSPLNNLHTLLDTGSRYTILSEFVASYLGFNLASPDFTADIPGAGGAAIQIPGFYLDTFSLQMDSGDLTFTDVPVLVYNVMGPDGSIVSAVAGTNLFADRHIVINPDPGNTYLAISDVVLIHGDLDGDGFVGITDLNIVLSNWNQAVPPGNPLADPSDDGFVGIEDMNVVLGNWNAGTPPSGTANIPEPGSFAMLLLSGTAVVCRGKRRS
jgi:Aspartyl protease